METGLVSLEGFALRFSNIKQTLISPGSDEAMMKTMSMKLQKSSIMWYMSEVFS